MGWQCIHPEGASPKACSTSAMTGLYVLAGAQAVHAAGRQRPSICLQGACAGPV